MFLNGPIGKKKSKNKRGRTPSSATNGETAGEGKSTRKNKGYGRPRKRKDSEDADWNENDEWQNQEPSVDLAEAARRSLMQQQNGGSHSLSQSHALSMPQANLLQLPLSVPSLQSLSVGGRPAAVYNQGGANIKSGREAGPNERWSAQDVYTWMTVDLGLCVALSLCLWRNCVWCAGQPECAELMLEAGIDGKVFQSFIHGVLPQSGVFAGVVEVKRAGADQQRRGSAGRSSAHSTTAVCSTTTTTTANNDASAWWPLFPSARFSACACVGACVCACVDASLSVARCVG